MTMSVLELAKQLLALDLCHGLKERLFEAGRGRLFGACCGCSSANCIFLRLFLLNLGGRWCISGKAWADHFVEQAWEDRGCLINKARQEVEPLGCLGIRGHECTWSLELARRLLAGDVKAHTEEEVQISLYLLIGCNSPRTTPCTLVEWFECELENGSVHSLPYSSIILYQPESSIDIVLLVLDCLGHITLGLRLSLLLATSTFVRALYVSD